MSMNLSKVRPLAFLAVVALGAVLISAVVAVDAQASKPESASASGPTLTVSPNPAPVGTDTFLITGAGFTPNKDVMIDLGVFPMYTVTPDGNGAFSLNFVSWSGGFYAGEFSAKALKYRGHNLVTVASTTFTVCSTNPCQ